MRKIVVAAIVIVCLAGLGMVSVTFLEEQAAHRIKEAVDRSGTHTVGSVDVSLLARRVTLHDIRNKNGQDFAFGRMQVSGLTWPLADLLSGRPPYADYRLGEPIRADRIQIDDARFSTAIKLTTIKSLTIYAFNLDRHDGPAQALSKDAEAFPNAALYARLLAALSIEKLQVTQLTESIKDSGKIGSWQILMERIDHGRVGTFTAFNMKLVTESREDLNVAEVKLANLNFLRLLKNLSSPPSEQPSLAGQVDAESTILSGFSGKFLSRYGMSLDSIGITSIEQGPGESRNQCRVDGLVFTLPAEANDMGAMAKLMKQADLKELKIGLDCRFSSSRPRAFLTFERCALAGPAIGEVDFTAKFVKVDEHFWKGIDENILLPLFLSAISVDSARLNITEKGILDLSLKALSLSRSAAAREIRRFQPPGILISRDMTALLDTVADFVESSSGILTIDAKPTSPVELKSVSRLFNRSTDIVSRLGLSASRSEKVMAD